LVLFGSGKGQVAGSCEYGDEPSGSIKYGEFLDKLSIVLASQEGLYSMEIAGYYPSGLTRIHDCEDSNCGTSFSIRGFVEGINFVSVDYIFNAFSYFCCAFMASSNSALLFHHLKVTPIQLKYAETITDLRKY
jgi:hypothetical protein